MTKAPNYAQQISEAVDQEMAKTLKDIPKFIAQGVHSVIPGMFGFTGRWGKWEVDNCNSRRSEISDWIGNKARAEFSKQCDKIITQAFIKKLMKDGGLKNAAQREFKKQFEKVLLVSVRDTATLQAQEMVGEFLKKMGPQKIITDLEKILDVGDNMSETQTAILEAEIEENVG